MKEQRSGAETLDAFMRFTEASPTAFHAAANLAATLRAEGWTELREAEPWEVRPGGRYYVIRNDSALIAASIPPEGLRPFRITAAHGDSPTFKLKPAFEDRTGEGYLRLSTEKYGGMIMSTWLDRPLSIAGRLVIREGKGLAVKLVNLERDSVLIPNMPIHFNREVNSGFAFDLKTDLTPLYGQEGEAGGLLAEIAAAAGVRPEEILGHDLFLYSRQKPFRWGAEGAFFSCGRIDDLECAWGAMEAFRHCEAKEAVLICAVFDNEEVGSASRQGADSSFLTDVLFRLGAGLGASPEQVRAAIAGGFMVSADNAHAVHPNHPEMYDRLNRTFMNRGVVIKHNASQKYTTDGLASARFEKICRDAGVPVQHFTNRSDLPGGSTLGNLSNTHVSLETVDIGLPQLAMHSACETAGVQDLDFLVRALRAMYSGMD